MTHMWERTVKKFIFVERVVMSAATFQSLPIVEAKPEALRGRKIYKALIERDGRTSWHVVGRQFQFGVAVYVARPIVIRVYAAEAA